MARFTRNSYPPRLLAGPGGIARDFLTFNLPIFSCKTFRKQEGLNKFLNSKFGHNWELIRELAVNDFKLKYNNSVLGYFWSLLKPLGLFGILYMVFSVFLRMGGGDKNYPFYLLIGIMLWMFFFETTVLSMQAIVGKANLVKKIFVPKIIIILATSLTCLMTFLLNLIVFFIFMLVFGLHFHFNFIMLPVYLIELYLFSFGLSLILSTLFVWFRDLAHIWEIVLQMMFYATPIIYPVSMIPAQYQKIIFINPVAQMIQDIRNIVLGGGQAMSSYPWLAPVATVVLMVFGLFIFNKKSKYFAEEV
jgi:ABC-2 type transport system permease protein